MSTFNPLISINSGQTFLWEKISNSWFGINSNNILKFTIEDTFLEDDTYFTAITFESYPEIRNWEHTFFRLDDDLNFIFQSFNDSMIQQIRKRYCGLRLLRQDPLQCTISFLCASNTNILRIQKMLKNLSRKYGERIIISGIEFYTFPTIKNLSYASINDLINCGLGYRAKFVKYFIDSYLKETICFRDLINMKYDDAKVELLKIYGIGNKVADCILLFSLEKLDSFPIDIWIQRVIVNNYSQLFDKNHDLNSGRKVYGSYYQYLSKSLRNYFGPFAGYAQQYLYFMIRNEFNKKWN